MQRVRGRVIPGPKLLETLQVHDRPRRLSKLKTHNKRPLRELLASYGLKLVRVDSEPIENYPVGIGYPSDKLGDRFVSLTIDGKPTRKMPCGLDSYQSPKMGYRSIANMISRDSEFIPAPDGEDALLHWP